MVTKPLLVQEPGRYNIITLSKCQHLYPATHFSLFHSMFLGSVQVGDIYLPVEYYVAHHLNCGSITSNKFTHRPMQLSIACYQYLQTTSDFLLHTNSKTTG